MAEIYLVRHGQASLGAADYDQLSLLGEEQSKYLGEYFGERGLEFDRVIIGGQKRHRQTLDAIVEGIGDVPIRVPEAEVNPGLSEYDHVELFETYFAGLPEAETPKDNPKEHFRLFRKALNAWVKGDLTEGLAETWVQFEKRVGAALNDVRNGSEKSEKVLVVSSGGPISCILKLVLGMAPEKSIELNLQIRNTSITQLHSSAAGARMTSFNNIPHLDDPARADAITYG